MSAVWSTDASRFPGRDLRSPDQRPGYQPWPFAQGDTPIADQIDSLLAGADLAQPVHHPQRAREVGCILRHPAAVVPGTVNPPSGAVRRTGAGAQAVLLAVAHEPEHAMRSLLGDEYFDDPPPAAASLQPADAGLGEPGDLHPLGELARALKRKPGTLRMWERRGTLPPAAHHAPGNGQRRVGFGPGAGGMRRMYTTAEIMAAVQVAADEGLLLGKGQVVDITKTEFGHRVRVAWERLRAAERAACE